MIRIALLITGTTRNYKENYITWKKYLLDIFNVDIFFHTYDVTGYKTTNISTFNGAEVIETLNPKKYIIDPFTDKINEFNKEITSQCLRSGSPKPEFIRAQLYSIYKSNELKKEYEKENNFEYDIVIKIRFDTIFHSYFNIKDIIKIYSHQNTILCGNSNIKVMKYKNSCKHCIKNFDTLLNVKCKTHTDISDIVFISRSRIMDYYADIYNKYNNYINMMFTDDLQKNNNDMEKYVGFTYENGAKIYYNVPNSQCPYPEKILSLYLKDYILLNYSISLDINRNIIK